MKRRKHVVLDVAPDSPDIAERRAARVARHRQREHDRIDVIGSPRTDPIISAIVDASPNFATQLDLATALRTAGR